MKPGHAGNGVVIKMDLNRAALKADARRRAAGYRPSPILAALIVFAIGMLISTLSSYLMGADRLMTALTNAAQFGADAVEQAYISFLEHYSVSGVAVVLVIALEIMNYMVSVGFAIFSLHVSRDEKAEIGNLFDGFGIFFRVLWLAILQGLLVFLWSLLLFVPGIIASYRYRQALYLLLDHPEKTAWQCLRESGQLMRGHKWELFVLDLSFLGWMLLSAMFAPVSSGSIRIAPSRTRITITDSSVLRAAHAFMRARSPTSRTIRSPDGFVLPRPACRTQAGCFALTSRGCAV